MRANEQRRTAGQEISDAQSATRRIPSAAGTGRADADTAAALQRSIGNAAFARMMSERHRHDAGCGHEEALQRTAVDEVGSVVRSAGSRLAPVLRREMEDRFEGEDFSDVTVHTGGAARRSAEAVGAEAYTTGTNHIVFRRGVDKKTLAHELEHGITPDGDLYTLTDVDTEDFRTDFLAAVKTTKHASGYSGTGGGASDWAASAVTAAHKQMRIDHPHWGDNTTLHHKIARSELDAILASADGDGARARPLFDFLDEVRAVLDSTAGNRKALHNMPANLEMGPSSDTRTGDPGSGTDYNFTPQGAMTPRSNELEEAGSWRPSRP
ncbi:DUF4157 domain-containing protein [Streptomyces sp. NPDC047706]|uniref:eCIS core domain-containing protein n=1 Tax=Streptomyces sp. NPDC047706 TaxID=3365486 RepID=UPI00371255C2